MPYQLSCSVKRSLRRTLLPHHSYELYFLNQMQQTCALLLVLASTLALGDVNARTHKKKPNIVFILTDDQDRVLTSNVSVHVRDGGYGTMGSLEVMTSLRTKLMEKGASFENFFVNTPICCPSRTQFFTGRYFHNSISKGKGSCMHANTSLVSSPKTGLFGMLTQRGGYNTGLFGKVTNDQRTFCGANRKESVSYIDSPLDYNNYMGATYFRYNAAVNKSTWVETLDKKQPIFGTNYQTTQIGNRTLRWLDGAIKESKEAAGRPFFAYVGPHAPHFPAMPAPYDEHAFDHLEMNPTKNYNYLCQKKAQHVAQNPALNERARCWGECALSQSLGKSPSS